MEEKITETYTKEEKKLNKTNTRMGKWKYINFILQLWRKKYKISM